VNNLSSIVRVLMRSQVTTKYLNGLIELIHSNLNTNENTAALENPRKHFERTLQYIESREYEGVETKPK
jgi:vacuolar protein sorting-associated protein 35